MTVSDFTLERLLLGELSDEEAVPLLADPEIVRKLELMRAENQRILARYPFPHESEKKERRQVIDFKALFHSLISAPVVGFATVALALTVLLIGPWFHADDTRVKGSSAGLVLYKNAGTDIRTLSDGDAVMVGDSLQVAYRSGGFSQGLIFSVDGNYDVTSHMVGAGYASLPLAGDGETLLDYAYLLDNAPDFEAFFFVRAKKPFSLGAPFLRKLAAATSEKQLRSIVTREFNRNFDISYITVRKDTHR